MEHKRNPKQRRFPKNTKTQINGKSNIISNFCFNPNNYKQKFVN